jgi:hypothetical protein
VDSAVPGLQGVDLISLKVVRNGLQFQEQNRPRQYAAATCAGERMGARRGELGWERPQGHNSDPSYRVAH